MQHNDNIISDGGGSSMLECCSHSPEIIENLCKELNIDVHGHYAFKPIEHQLFSIEECAKTVFSVCKKLVVVAAVKNIEEVLNKNAWCIFYIFISKMKNSFSKQ